jgi:hypothetical protein
MTITVYPDSDIEVARKVAVKRLTKQFIARGVSPKTALEWAEAETPAGRKQVPYWTIITPQSRED